MIEFRFLPPLCGILHLQADVLLCHEHVQAKQLILFSSEASNQLHAADASLIQYFEAVSKTDSTMISIAGNGAQQVRYVVVVKCMQSSS